MTQFDVALAADVPQSSVSKLERGTINVTVGTLERVASALGVDVVDLFVQEEEPTAIAVMVRKFSKLSEDEQRALLQTADLLLASRKAG